MLLAHGPRLLLIAARECALDGRWFTPPLRMVRMCCLLRAQSSRRGPHCVSGLEMAALHSGTVRSVLQQSIMQHAPQNDLSACSRATLPTSPRVIKTCSPSRGETHVRWLPSSPPAFRRVNPFYPSLPHSSIHITSSVCTNSTLRANASSTPARPSLAHPFQRSY